MAQVILWADGSLAPNPDGGESFAKFFEWWILEQSRDLAALRATATAQPDDADPRRLVDRVLSHNEHYYRAKSAAASADVLLMFAPSWISVTESLYLWCGGWRPTAAIQLLYSKSGVQLESQLPAFLEGGSLSAEQLLLHPAAARSYSARHGHTRSSSALAMRTPSRPLPGLAVSRPDELPRRQRRAVAASDARARAGR
ncbi:hypothetical protein CFC21_014403 [Triticum aestivum]|uniref:DOG1 domain-containing protein n=2 Tax=Triticum aestivum TaxID=4565 RepID=A0A3B6APB4_WHEAT|nr:hypothetical protein CFC21_014403 [Triticum aestivum]